MQDQAATPARLRLVGAADGVSGVADGARDAAPARSRWAEERRVRQEIIRENRVAAGNPALEPTDPRWVLAARAYAQLEGTAMTPEARERVMRTASALGMRPFDANVVIAIVQDHARRGESLGDAVPTLALINRPNRRRERHVTWMRWAAALGSAIVANLLLVRWLLSS